jgi:hypothetical protein
MDHKLLIAAALVAALTASPSSARTRHRPFPFVAAAHSDHRFQRFGGGFADSGYDLQSSYDDLDWAADAGNDWWNDRPDRAFPRWVQHNQNCTPDRMWWSGSGWHC